jgi:hypothetical protein
VIYIQVYSPASSLPVIYYPNYIIFVCYLCRMKILECKNRGTYDVGFANPYIVNEIMLQRHPKTWSMTCTHFLPSKVSKGKLYFLTTSHECSYLVHILFCLLDIKCNWWVMHVWVCKRVRRFHWILLKVQFDKSTVEVMDSLDKPEALWSNMKAMLQK